MKLAVSSLSDLDLAISDQARSDYIYMYPPRQAYRSLKLGTESTKVEIRKSIRDQPALNIYVHVPFCHQLCGFCNLYTTTIRSREVQDAYVSSVLKQIDGFLALLPDRKIPTVYFGGGTPTVLEKQTLQRLVSGVLGAFPDRTAGCEVAIEVDPQTVNAQDLQDIRELGINRINLGLQTRDDAELKSIGRRYGSQEQWTIASNATSVGFDNVCLDLIYGLPAQTADSWKRSVLDCIDLNPHTICCYPLTERPHTGFAKSSRTRSADSDYRMWEYADTALRSAGYERQSHVRWARDGGGYIQKELHWGLQNLVGFGAGARSYLWDIDLRMNYSIRERRRALDLYLADVDHGDVFPHEGFQMTADERVRKAVILGLHSLDADAIAKVVGIDPLTMFESEFEGLADRGLLAMQGRSARLTHDGMKYRDLVVQLFFSDQVRRLTADFSYNE